MRVRKNRHDQRSFLFLVPSIPHTNRPHTPFRAQPASRYRLFSPHPPPHLTHPNAARARAPRSWAVVPPALNPRLGPLPFSVSSFTESFDIAFACASALWTLPRRSQAAAAPRRAPGGGAGRAEASRAAMEGSLCEVCWRGKMELFNGMLVCNVCGTVLQVRATERTGGATQSALSVGTQGAAGGRRGDVRHRCPAGWRFLLWGRLRCRSLRAVHSARGIYRSFRSRVIVPFAFRLPAGVYARGE